MLAYFVVTMLSNTLNTQKLKHNYVEIGLQSTHRDEVYTQVYFVILLTKGKQPPELAKDMDIELSP